MFRAVLAVGLAVAVGVSALPVEMFRLPNGLTVILHEDHSARRVRGEVL